MFEHLKYNEDFNKLNEQDRKNWFDQYYTNNVLPVVMKENPDKAQEYYNRLYGVFVEDTKKTPWEAFRDASLDLLGAPGRLLLGAGEAANEALAAVSPSGSAAEKYFLDSAKTLDELQKRLVADADMADLHETAVSGLGINYFMGRTLFAYSHFTSPGVQAVTKAPFTKALFTKPVYTPMQAALAETAGRITAFTGSIGDLAVTSVMDSYVSPYVDSKDWSPSTKEAAKIAAFFALGFASGFGPEQFLDKTLNNPTYHNILENAAERAVKGFEDIPESFWDALTPQEKITVALEKTGVFNKIAADVNDPLFTEKTKTIVEDLLQKPERDFEEGKELVRQHLQEEGLMQKVAEMSEDEFEEFLALKKEYENLSAEDTAFEAKSKSQLEEEDELLKQEEEQALAKLEASEQKQVEDVEQKPVEDVEQKPIESKEQKLLEQKLLEQEEQKLEGEDAPGVNEGTTKSVEERLHQDDQKIILKPEKKEIPEIHNEPEAVVDANLKIHVRFLDDARPSQAQKDLLLSAGYYNRQRKIWVLENNPKSREIIKKVYELAEATQENEVAKIGPTGTRKVVDMPEKILVTQFGAEPTQFLRTGDGQFYYIRFSDNAKPSSAQRAYMKLHKVLWNSQAKGWYGQATENTKRVYEAVKAMAQGILPKDATEEIRNLFFAEQAAKKKVLEVPTAPKEDVLEGLPETADLDLSKVDLPVKEEPKKKITTKKQAPKEKRSKTLAFNSKNHSEVVKLYNAIKGTTVKAFRAEPQEVKKLLAAAYNFANPDDYRPLTEAGIKQTLKAIEVLESSLEGTLPVKGVENFQAGITNLVRAKLLTEQSAEVIRRVFDSLPQNNHATIRAIQNASSFYDFIQNAIGISDPLQLFHEVGHWVWWNVLDASHRMKFFETIHSKYKTKEAWSSLWEVRRMFLQNYAKLDKRGQDRLREQLRQVGSLTELYADLFRQYVLTYQLPGKEAQEVIQEGLKHAGVLLDALRKEIPEHLHEFFDRAFLAPRSAATTQDVADDLLDILKESPLYVNADEFANTLKEFVGDEDVIGPINDRLLSYLQEKVNDSSENFLERAFADVYTDVLFFIHGRRTPEEAAFVGQKINALGNHFTPEGQAETIKKILEYAHNSDFVVSKKQVEDIYKFYKTNYEHVRDLFLLTQNTVLHGSGAGVTRDGIVFDWMQVLSKQAKQEMVEYSDELAHSKDYRQYATPAPNPSNVIARWRWMPQFVSFLLGFDVDDQHGIPVPFTNVRVNWNPKTWAMRGGPLLSAYDMFGPTLRHAAKNAAIKRWQKLDLDTQLMLENKWRKLVKNEAVRAFLPKSGLPEDVYKLTLERFKTENRVKRNFAKLASKLNETLPIEEQRLIGSIISDEPGFSVKQLSPEGKTAYKLIQQLVEETNQLLVNAGIPKELLESRGMEIIPLAFEKELKAMFSGGLEKYAQVTKYQQLFTDFLIPQGFVEKWKNSDYKTSALIAAFDAEGIPLEPGAKFIYDPELVGLGIAPVTAKTDLNKHAGFVWKVLEYDPDKMKLVVQRPYTEFEKRALKAETSIVPRLVEFSKNVSKFIARAQLFEKIGSNPSLALDLDSMLKAGIIDEIQYNEYVHQLLTKGWEKVPETTTSLGIKRFGKLSGHFVHPEVMYALKVVTSGPVFNPVLHTAIKSYKNAIGLWKIGKTAYQVTTHGINFLGNNIMCVLDGRNPLAVIKNGVKEVLSKGKYYREAVDEGLLDSNVLSAEVDLVSWLKSVEKTQTKHHTDGFVKNMAEWFRMIGRGTKKALAAPIKAYEFGDQLFKVGVFIQERMAGASTADAMEAANRLFFDYRDVPKGIKFLRDSGIIPFVSYTYKLIPQMISFAKENPHRLMALLFLAESFHNIMLAETFGEDWKEAKEFLQEMAPSWMKRTLYGTGVVGAIPTKVEKNERGVSYVNYLDFSQIFPGGTFLNDGGILGGFPFGINPIVSILYGLSANKDAVLGETIAPFDKKAAGAFGEKLPPELEAENAKARLKFIMRNLLPNLPIYSGAYSYERLGQALVGSGVISKETGNRLGFTGVDYYGTPMTMGDELFRFVTGIKNNKLYFGEEMARRMDKIKYGIKQSKNVFKRRARDARISSEELQKEAERMQTVTQAHHQELARLQKVAEKARKALSRLEKTH